MDKKRIIMAGGMVVVAFVLFSFVRRMGTPEPVVIAAPETPVEEVQYVGVLSAALDMPLGSRVGVESLAWVDWPAEAVTPSLITETDQPEAKEDFVNAIVRSGIVTGEPINVAKLVTDGGSGVMAALLNPGMRAVTTRISPDTAAGGFIQPGDRVDIILTQTWGIETGDTPQGQIIVDSVTRSTTIFENVRVLAIDQVFSTSPEGGADIIGSTATFELNPEDVELLQESESIGDLSLTLRGLTGSNAYSRSAATFSKKEFEIEENADASAGLTLYRSGQAQRVAIEGQK